MTRATGWRIARVALLLGIGFLLFRQLQLRELGNALKNARWEWVLFGAVFHLNFNTWGRLFRFQAFLGALGKAPLKSLLPLLLATRALHLILPARMGEAYRVARLKSALGVPPELATAAILMETVVEALALGLLAPWILWMLRILGPLGQEGRSPLSALLLMSTAAVGALSLLLVLGSRRRKLKNPDLSQAVGWIQSLWLRFSHAFHLMSQPRHWLKGLFWTGFADASDLVCVGACLHALGIPLGPVDWIWVFLGINLAIALPLSPGNWGTLEAGAVIALGMLGVPEQKSLAFALVYHAAQTLPIAIMGAGVFFLQESSSKTRNDTDARCRCSPPCPQAR